MRLILIILTFGIVFTNGLSQKKEGTERSILRAKYIDFYHNDSVISSTLIIEPTGYFYFSNGLIFDSKDFASKFLIDNGTTIKDSLVIDTSKIIKLISRFDNLVTDSNSIKNYYPHPYKPLDFYYELEYSFILDNLIESKLSRLSNYKIVRIIIPKETSGVPRDYFSIRINLNDREIVYKMGKFDYHQDYQLIQNDSATLTIKQIDKLSSMIDLVDFNNIEHFTEVGLDLYPKYLIEYFDGTKYHVFEKKLFSKNNKDKELNKLVSEILTIKNKTIKEK